MNLRLTWVVAVLLVMLFAGCSEPVENSTAYKAACHGPPLRNIEQRSQAQEDGYQINRVFDCIDRASYVTVRDENARLAAARAPEAIVQREAERARWYADQQARVNAAQLARDDTSGNASTPPPVVRFDVNTASESELAAIPTVRWTTASEIIKQRGERRFTSWADLVGRVVSLSAAQSAVYASICGLTVNGESLLGAPPEATMAARLREKFERQRP